jgi:hypothetical protein
MLRASVHLRRGDTAAARQELDLGKAAGGEFANLQVLEAVLADRAGRADQAMHLLATAETSHELGLTAIVMAAGVMARHGDLALAMKFIRRPFLTEMEVLTRLEPDLRPLLEHEAFAPRRSKQTLVWPLEAPPVPDEVAELFAAVRTESAPP